MTAFHDPQLPQSSLAQADPQRSIPVDASFAYRTDFEPMQTQSSPYSTWSQVNPSDYNPSQPQSEEFQQIYDVNQNLFPQPYSHINCAATFISTSGPQTGSPLSFGSLYPPPVMEPKSYNSHLTNSTNGFVEDGISNGGPSNTKKRRRQSSLEGRENTQNVRKMGSCARCRKMKLRVMLPLLLLPCQVCLPYLSATKKPPAASAERYSAKLGPIRSRAAMIIYATSSWPVKVSEPPLLL